MSALQGDVMEKSAIKFIREQGVTTESIDSTLFHALMFQPRVVVAIVSLGVLLQNAWVFLALGAVLLVSAVRPGLNPFDAIYNRAVAAPRGLRQLDAAPAPRRFAQALGGTHALATGLALVLDAGIAAYPLEAVLLVASLAVVVRRFCPGAALYHTLRRHGMYISAETLRRTFGGRSRRATPSS